MKKNSILKWAAATMLLASLGACQDKAQDLAAPKTDAQPAAPVASNIAIVTTGPNGETASPASEVALSADEEAKIKAGNYTAALVWHEMSDFTHAVNQGAKDEFARLGIKVLTQTDANFKSERQKSDVETVMAQKPSIIVSLPVDSTTAAATYAPAQAAGVKLVFLDNAPKGYVQGKDYVTLVSDDLAAMGIAAADAMAKALDNKGKVGYIFHDAVFHVTNSRDQAFKKTIETKYPGMKIVSEMGLADPARAEDVAQAMMAAHPDLDGVYVTWAEPALGVLSTLRSMGNSKTKIVTLDLSEPLALDMLKNGNTAAIVADEAYNIGRTAARTAAGSLLGKSYPPFLVVNAFAVTKGDVVQAWQKSLHKDAPKSVLDLSKP